MAGQFLLNLFIAFLYVFLKDEQVFHIDTFITGFLIGSLIVFVMRRFYGGRFYLHKLLSVIKLLLIFVSEIMQSSYVVIRHILSPKINIEPGIFKYTTVLRGDWQVTTLALLLTLTPGSVVMEVTEDGTGFYIHAMDIKRYKGDLESSLKRFEKAILEVTR
ncbi:MAG TPA: Na+/H+ antiporter subunit E [Pseudogracilibacillus sp.]|nr:Na+/H+ antiporter subunit E [Pseudogracilibacillus sp.]